MGTNSSFGWRRILVPIFILTFSAAPVAFGQQTPSKSKPVVVLTSLSAPTSDPVAEKLATTIGGSVELLLRLVGNIQVERADFLLPSASIERATEYYKNVGASAAVFGDVRPESGGKFQIELDIWRSVPANVGTTVIKTTVSDLLAAFDVADHLSLEVASTVTGHELSVGTLVVKNLDSLPKYSVYSDGNLLGRDRSTFKVLVGNREIIVAKPGVLGDTPLETFHVTIAKDETTVVSLKAGPPKNSTPTPSKPAPAVVASPATSPPAAVVFREAPAILAYKQGGFFRDPVLTYGRQKITLNLRDEYAWALALISNLPGITPQIRANLGRANEALGRINGPREADAGLAAAIRDYEALPESARRAPLPNTTFNSVADFSGAQGQGGWYYGYRTGSHSNFQLMTEWKENQWWSDFGSSFALVNRTGLMGNTYGKVGQLSPQAAVRRFVVPVDGVYKVHLVFNLTELKNTGAVVSLQHNDTEEFSKDLSSGDTSAYNFHTSLSCRRGDTIDLVAVDAGDGNWDYLGATFTIDLQKN
ncbi:MAG TPA: hypothetical protein VMW69_06535 [Spirochaetia bacterium]|nr:hypothetical protein [Spirochaetia bacterium]